MKLTTRNILYLLRESNSIEREFDSLALLDAYYAWEFIQKFEIKNLNISVLEQLHLTLMNNRSTIPEDEKGVIRNFPIRIGNKIKSQPKIVIESLLKDWIDRVKDINNDSIQLHIEYENIHPWADGNGRTGRILLWWLQSKRRENLTKITERNKYEYYKWFN